MTTTTLTIGPLLVRLPQGARGSRPVDHADAGPSVGLAVASISLRRTKMSDRDGDAPPTAHTRLWRRRCQPAAAAVPEQAASQQLRA